MKFDKRPPPGKHKQRGQKQPAKQDVELVQPYKKRKVNEPFTLYILMDFPIQIKAIRMGGFIIYFKWSQASISEL